jgi:hypothetical protein
MGEEIMNETEDMADFVAALFVWVESVNIRMYALEAMVTERLTLTDKDWQAALVKAQSQAPLLRESNLEGLPAAVDFLKRASKR